MIATHSMRQELFVRRLSGRNSSQKEVILKRQLNLSTRDNAPYIEQYDRRNVPSTAHGASLCCHLQIRCSWQW
jgi:hypothetical protein